MGQIHYNELIHIMFKQRVHLHKLLCNITKERLPNIHVLSRLLSLKRICE